MTRMMELLWRHAYEEEGVRGEGGVEDGGGGCLLVQVLDESLAGWSAS